MNVLLARFQADEQGHETAQTVGNGRLSGRGPYGVGDQDRVGLEPVLAHQLGQGTSEARAAHLLLAFPEKLEVQADATRQRQPAGQQRGQRRTLVVGGAAAKEAVADHPGLEGRSTPAFAVGGLDIEVVVDGDGGELRDRISLPHTRGKPWVAMIRASTPASRR